LRSDRGTAGSVEKQSTTIARVNNRRKGRRKKDSPATKGGSCIHLPHSSGPASEWMNGVTDARARATGWGESRLRSGRPAACGLQE
jgi:hypothetical protein